MPPKRKTQCELHPNGKMRAKAYNKEGLPYLICVPCTMASNDSKSDLTPTQRKNQSEILRGLGQDIRHQRVLSYEPPSTACYNDYLLSKGEM